MILQLIFLLLGLFLLILGSNYLLKSSVELSLKYNISKVVIGLTVVSFATSAPELLISISSALKSSSDIAISNVIGSNIANIGLVFSTALFFVTIKISKNNVKYDLPWLLIVSAVFFFFLQDLIITKYEGIILVALLSVFIYFMFKMRELLPKVSMYGAGAIFQWTAGSVKRAPLAWQKLGLEWFWRLINDPIRLWRRYLIDNTLFLLLFTKQYLKSTKFSEPLKR